MKKTQGSGSGHQTHARASLTGGGPTGPLGVGSRLLAQRKKQQTTAGSLVADLAPKRPARVIAPSSVIGNKPANTKSATKQHLGSTQQNMLNSSQSSQRNSVVEQLGYWTKGSGRLSKAAPAGGHTVASRAKATSTAPGLLNRDLSQTQFGATTNFS